MAKQTTQERLPEYVQTILNDLEENEHCLSYTDNEWLVRTFNNRRLVATAPSLEELAKKLQAVSVEEEEETLEELDWTEAEEELDEISLNELDDDEDDLWSNDDQ